MLHNKYSAPLANIIIALLSVFLLWEATPIHAQYITVRTVPSQDKLPVNAIHRIFQDSDGYMWYGTFNGLCRYDGYNIRVFRSDLFHPGLLSDNYISYIIEDHKKTIWFGTLKGAYTLDKATNRISPIDLGEYSDKHVYSMNVTRDGSIWISTPGMLFRFGTDKQLIRKYVTEYNHTPRSVFTIYEDKADNLLISLTGGGLYRLNPETDELEPYCHHPLYMNIERIIYDEIHHCYWLGTWGTGIVRFHPDNSPESRYIPQPLPVDILGQSIGNLYHMVQDDIFHYLWVTTERDLFAFRITPEATLEQVNTSSFLSQDNKILYEIYKDKEGKLWVSAFDRPSFIVDIREHILKKYPLEVFNQKLKANPAIMAFTVDKDGTFWLSQERDGLFTYHPDDNSLKHYTDFTDTRHLPFGHVRKIINSHTPHCAWIMPDESAVYKLRQDGGKMSRMVEIELEEISDHPRANVTLFEDATGDLWIGTTNGLFVYRERTGKLELLSDSLGHVSDITRTVDGKIWATVRNKGIVRIQGNQLESYPSDEDFLCVDATSDGKLWVGTGEGKVLRFDTEQKRWTDYSHACGMKGDIINSITVDIYNHVWIATNQIIKEFNPRNGAYRIYNTRNQDVLPTRLLTQAVWYDGKGDIYFGGISGIVSIPPSQQLESIPEQVTTHITDIKILGQSIWDNTPEENPLNGTLSIAPSGQNLEIEFSSLDFHNLDQIRYAYRLVGVDKDWIYLDEGKNSAFYNKLSKGNYTFQVKATDRNGLWSDRVTELTIYREPAYYETWGAYLLYGLIVLFIAGLAIMLYLKRVKHEYKEEMDRQIQLKISELEEEESAPDETFLNKAVEVVERHLSDEHFDTIKLAGELNMSRSTFNRRIKSITGQTPLGFIKDIKMQHAKQLLENRATTVADVMTAVGYTDYKNFTSSFKEKFGVTPKDCLRKEKETPND